MKSHNPKIKKIIKKQKAVSPIIASILLIGLTVLAGALVYTVVLPLLNPPVNANLTVSFKSAYDYNNDGQIDAILVTVYNNNFDSIQLTTTGLKNWEIVPMYNKTLDGMSSTDVLLITSISSAQYKVNDQVTIGLGNDVSNLSGNQITLASFTVPNPTTIFVQNAQPNTKVKFVIYPEGQSVSIAPLSLNSNDQAQVYLLPNWYKALTTDNAYSSSAFHNVLTSFVEVNEQVQPAFSTVTVSVVDNANQPVSGITVYTTDQNQNDVGINGLTDGSGKTSIYLQNGLYYFRVNYLGNDYWSSLKTVTVDSSITIKIGGNVLIGKAVFSGQGVGNGILLRLFTQNNVSMSKYSYTNASSYFYIGSVVPGFYRFRMDYQNNYYWSPIFSSSEQNLVVDFGGGSLTVWVKAGGTPLPNGVLTRLFNSDNSSTSRYSYLNSSGYANYGPTPAGQYLLRIDWQNKYYYTGLFDHQDNSLVVLDIGGGSLSVLVTAGGSPLPNGVLTRLFNADNTSTSRYAYLNSTGYANYGSTPAGQYLLRIDWQNEYYYSSIFVHSDSSPMTVDIGGGSLSVLVTAGGSPLPNGVLTRLVNDDNTSTSRYSYLNTTGYANYGSTPAGQYFLRVDWQNEYYYTTVFVHSDSTPKTVNIGGGNLMVLVTANGHPLPNGVLTRLFNADNTSTSRYSYLNATGYAYYGLTPVGSYLLRIDWQNNYYYTTVFVHSDSSPKTVNIGGGNLVILVTAGGYPFPNGVLTRLFNADNTSTSRYCYLNATGYANYGPTPAGSYLLRIDWLNAYFYTTVFVHSSDSLKTVNLGGGLLNIQIKVGGNNLPNGALVRLFLGTNQSASWYAYVNSTGYSNFGAIPAGQYIFRYDASNGSYYYTQVYNWTGQSNPTTTLSSAQSPSKFLLQTVDVLRKGISLGIF